MKEQPKFLLVSKKALHIIQHQQWEQHSATALHNLFTHVVFANTYLACPANTLHVSLSFDQIQPLTPFPMNAATLNLSPLLSLTHSHSHIHFIFLHIQPQPSFPKLLTCEFQYNIELNPVVIREERRTCQGTQAKVLVLGVVHFIVHHTPMP